MHPRPDPFPTDAPSGGNQRFLNGLWFCTALLLIGRVIAETRSLRIVTADDAAIAAALEDPLQALANRAHDFRIGRFYADTKFWFLEAIMRMESDWGRATLRLGAFLAALLPTAWLVRRAGASWPASQWVVLLGLALLPVSISYQALLSYPLLWFGWGAVWLLAGAALGRPALPHRSWFMAGCYLLALLVHEANAAFLVVPAVLLGLDSDRPRFGRVFRELLPCLGVLAVYLALFGGMRHAASAVWSEEPYLGGIIRWDFGQILYGTLVYTGSGLPSFDSWLALSAEPGAGVFKSPGRWLSDTLVRADGIDWLSALLVGCWIGLSGGRSPATRTAVSRQWLLPLLLAMALVSNLILSLTPKYQSWAHQRMWPYYYSAMSYLAFLALAAVAGQVLAARPWARRRGTWLAAGAMAALLALAVSGQNRHAASLLRQQRFDHFHRFTLPPAAAPVSARP